MRSSRSFLSLNSLQKLISKLIIWVAIIMKKMYRIVKYWIAIRLMWNCSQVAEIVIMML